MAHERNNTDEKPFSCAPLAERHLAGQMFCKHLKTHERIFTTGEKIEIMIGFFCLSNMK